MHARVGTSGYQYAYWRGTFYTKTCKEAHMLGELGQRLSTVEINSTFYKLPEPHVMEKWASQVPDGFRFAVKAPRRITHIRRLNDVGEQVTELLQTTSALGDKLAVVLFQLPSNFKSNLDRLDGLLSALEAHGSGRYAIEFRHETWFTDEVLSRLRAKNVALCLSDEGEGEKAVPWVPTADFGYLRLRKNKYPPKQLAAVAVRVNAEAWTEALAYFKHEPDAPKWAAKLQALL